MTRYDLECFLDDVRTLLASSLNTKLTEIDSDKADSITLRQVDAAGYFLQSLDTQNLNVDPFVVYGVEEPVADMVAGPGLSVKYKAYVLLVIADAGNDANVFRRLYRYQRALLELFCTNWADLSRGKVRTKVAGLNPFMPDLIGLKSALAVGVTLSFTLE